MLGRCALDAVMIICYDFSMFSWLSIKVRFRRYASLAILASIASVFFVLSCYGKSLQSSTYPGFHTSSQSCEKQHVLQSGETHAENSMFDGITMPNEKTFLAVAFVVIFFSLFPKLSEQFNRSVKVAFIHNQRKRWVWSRNLPFSSVGFFPYFAALRDH